MVVGTGLLMLRVFKVRICLRPREKLWRKVTYRDHINIRPGSDGMLHGRRTRARLVRARTA